MSNRIKLDLGVKTIEVVTTTGITHDIALNVEDVSFVEALHELYQRVGEKSKELKEYEESLDEPLLDENGVPIDISLGVKKTKEINTWIRSEIDSLLGKGTSQAIFGDLVFYGERFGAYVDLIVGIIGFVRENRSEKTKKYVKK